MATAGVVPTIAPNLMQNLVAGNSQYTNNSLSNIGLPPVGNGAGSQVPGASSITAGNPTGRAAGAVPGTSLATPSTTPVQATATPVSGAVPTTATLSGQGSTQITVPTSGSGPSSDLNTAAQTDTLTQLQNQYGKGIGATIASTLENLGSNNSSYMQAYEQSLAQPTAENLATLQTTLSNEGVGANSSTSAIAQADYEAGVTSQEGLQEQQLLQSQTGEEVGLLESLEGVANKNQGTSILGDIGSTLSGIASGVGDII